MAIVDNLLSSLNSEELSEIAGELGLDHEKMYAAIKDAIPTILTGLNANAQSDEGAESLSAALDDHQDAKPLGNLGALISGQLGNGILGHVFGGSTEDVAEALGHKNGLSGADSQKLLAIVAPLIMSLLAKNVAKGGSVKAELESETGVSHDVKPDIGSIIGGLLGAA